MTSSMAVLVTISACTAVSQIRSSDAIPAYLSSYDDVNVILPFGNCKVDNISIQHIVGLTTCLRKQLIGVGFLELVFSKEKVHEH